MVVGSDSLCVELGHCFSIFGLGVVEGISGFFFFCVLVCCCRVGHTSTQSAFLGWRVVVVLGVGICFEFFVWEFALSVWLGFVVGVCHVIF